ncbi:hypothetical protein C8R45DRAFT_1075919 [Mycena sanguinolenta]|nr:hypothetical protein C8R45DRAFT_1075919 [Mycena sanguinolenta]
MPAIPQETVSTAASKLSNKYFIAFVVLAALATMLYYLRPSHLITILLAAMAETRKVYREAQEMGLPAQTEMDTLRQKVSVMVQETRHNAESWLTALCDFLSGRTFTLLYCIYKVQSYGMHIKMLKDIAQLRSESNLPPWPTPQSRHRPFRDYVGSCTLWLSACLHMLRRSSSQSREHPPRA